MPVSIICHLWASVCTVIPLYHGAVGWAVLGVVSVVHSGILWFVCVCVVLGLGGGGAVPPNPFLFGCETHKKLEERIPNQNQKNNRNRIE